MRICDLHTHSNNSFDAKNSVEEMCNAAIKQNMYAIAISDHCECPMIDEKENCEFGYFDKLIPKSIKEAYIAKDKFKNKLKVLCGIELGEPCHNIKLTKKALNYGDYDFILASVHNMRNMKDFYYLEGSIVNNKDILNMYFDELLETANFEHFDSLAHLTYPLRYIKEKDGSLINLKPYQDKIDKIYNCLIQNNKALEINVSGIVRGLGCTLPDELQIKRYKELGGQYITIGTDSHLAQNVGVGIEDGINIAKKCGFTHYTIFEKRKPKLIEI